MTPKQKQHLKELISYIYGSGHPLYRAFQIVCEHGEESVIRALYDKLNDPNYSSW